MMKIAFVAGILLAAGCGSKTDNALSEFEGFKDKMCACTDKACAEKVVADMLEWSKKMKEEGVKKSDLSDEQKQKRKEIDKAMDACRDKLMK